MGVTTLIDYPPRGRGFYCNRFMAYVLRSGVALQLGCEAVTLLMSVALTEDKTRYSKPVQFWNDQLTAYLGCRVDRLNQIRKRLVDAGWLHYEPGRKGVAGRYWVLVPGGDENLNDAVLGDNTFERTPDSPADNFPDGKAHTKAHHKPSHNAHHKPSPFLPNPNPYPNTGRGSGIGGGKGKSKQPNSHAAKSSSPWAAVTVEMLRLNNALMVWLDGQAVIERTEENRVWCLAAAERAIDPEVKAINPASLFVTLAKDLSRGDRSKLSADQYDRAKVRLHTWRAAPSVMGRNSTKLNGQPKSIMEALHP